MASTRPAPSSLQLAGSSTLGGGAMSPRSPSLRGSMAQSPVTSPHGAVARASNISRPDDSNSLANITSKRNKGFGMPMSPVNESNELVRGAGPSKQGGASQKAPVLQTPAGETCITKKEDALEQIMCAEAFAGFERMARHQLNKGHANRTSVDPDKMGVDMDLLNEYYLDGSDNAEPDSDSDDEVIQKQHLDAYHAGAGEEPVNPQTWGMRLGFGFMYPSKRQVPQDRVFVSHCGEYTLMGIVNSHGSQQIGQELARFIAEELPRAFFKSPWFTQEKDLITALSHAFDRTHRKAIKQVDCRLTGSCCTVVLLDETSVYVAHVGNCRALLAVPDPNTNAQSYHFIPVPLGEDHKLSVRKEFDRILEHGGEVRRLVNDNTHRLFFKDDYIPGLTLTRGIGHRMAHPIGVTHFPAIHVLQRRELHRDAFIVLGSGGVYHAMSERAIVNWIGRHFDDPRDAAVSLGKECKRRWEDPNTRLKAFVQKGAGECFSSLIFYPALDSTAHRDCASLEDLGGAKKDAGYASQPPRQFQLGPHDVKVARRPWKEVRHINWKEDLSIIMAGSRPEREKEEHDGAF